MQAVPTSHGIALGIIKGHAGVGKTFMMASLISAMLRDSPSKKILVVTPSNDSTNVAARKVWEEAKKYPETKDLIFLRGHNATAENNYTVAFAKLEALKAKQEADKLKTPEDLANDVKRQVLIDAKKARGAAAEKAKREKDLQNVLKNLPPRRAPENSNKFTGPGFQGGLSGPDGTLSGSPTLLPKPEHSEVMETAVQALSFEGQRAVLDVAFPPLLHDFNDEVVVSTGSFNADGSIDIQRLERDLDLGKAIAGLRMSQHLSKYMALGENLIRDLRFQEVKQSLGWIVLVVAGDLVPGKNKYTDAKKWASFRVLFKDFMKRGDNMDSADRASLDEYLKELREFCIQKASVFFSTENNMATGLYVLNLKFDIVLGMR
jgi:hypothetical protein